jgi:hypothetical protein
MRLHFGSSFVFLTTVLAQLRLTNDAQCNAMLWFSAVNRIEAGNAGWS